MTRRKNPAPSDPAPKLVLTAQEIERGITRLDERISELKGFDVQTLRRGGTPELAALEVAIKDTLERCFGEDTAAYRRYQQAAALDYYPMMFFGGEPIDYVGPIGHNIKNAVALLVQAQRTLREDLADLQHKPALTTIDKPAEGAISRRVFVVHGHDEGAREMVARFLDKIGFEPVILHEQANQGRTVIEKIEAQADVGFAVVLLTPDDEGCVRNGTPEPRARQNVLLELGYFLGRLGRARVCALKRGQVEIPSDFAGVVWENMDANGGWRLALGRELEAASFEVDWNKVMRPA